MKSNPAIYSIAIVAALTVAVSTQRATPVVSDIVLAELDTFYDALDDCYDDNHPRPYTYQELNLPDLQDIGYQLEGYSDCVTDRANDLQWRIEHPE